MVTSNRCCSTPSLLPIPDGRARQVCQFLYPCRRVLRTVVVLPPFFVPEVVTGGHVKFPEDGYDKVYPDTGTSKLSASSPYVPAAFVRAVNPEDPWL